VAGHHEQVRPPLLSTNFEALVVAALVVSSIACFFASDVFAGPLSCAQWTIVSVLVYRRSRRVAAHAAQKIWKSLALAFGVGSLTLFVFFLSATGWFSAEASHFISLVSWMLWAISCLAAVVALARIAQPLLRVPRLSVTVCALYVGLCVDFEVVLWSRFAGVVLANRLIVVLAAAFVIANAFVIERELRRFGRRSERLMAIGAAGFAVGHAVVALAADPQPTLGQSWFPTTLFTAFLIGAARSPDAHQLATPILPASPTRRTATAMLVTCAAASIVLAGCYYGGWTPNLTVLLGTIALAQAVALAAIFGRSEPIDVRGYRDRVLRAGVRHAVLNEEFVPFFQPILRATDGAVVGYECLVRWLHPTRGVLLPAIFLGIAQREGVLDDIDRQMMHATVDNIDALIGQLDVDEPFVSVNVNSQRLRNPTFASEVIEYLRSQGRDGSGLVIEVSEHPSDKDIDLLVRNVEALQNFGVGIAIDDFGSGHSNYQLLLHLDPDIVKLDLSVITAAETGNRGLLLTRSAVLAASGVGAKVLAEGVASHEFGRELAGMGVHLLQGFGLGTPQPLVATVGTACL
jgi:EAL domain-containing protein (putative c-di-GMP-specific phosphodiesterase class I)